MEDQILIGGLLIAAWTDAMFQKIPNQMLLVLLGVRVCLLIVRNTGIGISVAGFLIGGIAMLAAYLLSKKGMGAGDVKLMAIVGSYVGVDKILQVLFTSFFTAAIYSLLQLARKEIRIKDQLPFAPFVLVGVIISVLCWKMEQF